MTSILTAMPGSSRKPRVIIVGGSMSGLFSAAFLRQIGWDVDVYERSNVELVGRGAGITTHPELLDALEAAGAGTQDLGIEIPKRIALDRDWCRQTRDAQRTVQRRQARPQLRSCPQSSDSTQSENQAERDHHRPNEVTSHVRGS